MIDVAEKKRFRQDRKLAKRQGKDINILNAAVDILQCVDGRGEDLPPHFHAHILSGKYAGCWECHLQPNWLLIWQVDESANKIILRGTGSHPHLFG